MDLLENIKLYKNFYRGIDASQLLSNCEVSMHTLQNFDKDYQCIKKMDFIKNGCIESNIFTVKQYSEIIKSHMQKMRPFFNNKRLNSCGVNKILHPSEGKSFVPLQPGKKYLALDMKKAYGQFIDSFNIFDDKLDNIIFEGLPDFVKESKKLRLFMYYQIPGFLIQTNNIITLFDDILQLNEYPLINCINEHKLEPVSYNIDEIVFDIDDCTEDFTQFIGTHEVNNLLFNVNIFEEHYISYIPHDSEKEKHVEIREYSDRTYYATNRCIYGNQLYKAYNNLPITDSDLYIANMNSNDYIKLNEPIKITKIQ